MSRDSYPFDKARSLSHDKLDDFSSHRSSGQRKSKIFKSGEIWRSVTNLKYCAARIFNSGSYTFEVSIYLTMRVFRGIYAREICCRKNATVVLLDRSRRD